MAYIAQTSIRSDSHMEHAVDYITKEEKALTLSDMKKHLNNHLTHMGTINTSVGERATYINCSSQNTYKDFENLRQAFNQDKGVIAHHYYQSFQKDDNVTPEQAHQIGVALAKKMFPNFQVVIATHTDREHLHNHIIVNSCNMITGQKWHSNKNSLAEIRKESDKLCLANGLGTIKENSKYKGIDRTTYQLGLKGKSWKIKLVRDLDTAVQQCKSKADFIAFMNSKDYTVRYTEQHITFTKNGEKKGVRADTLAKQFGEKYKKDSLEKIMGYYTEPLSSEKQKQYHSERKQYKRKNKSNWNYYEEWTFKQKKYFPSTPEKIVRDYQTERMINRAERSLLCSQNPFSLLIKLLILLLALSQRRKKKVQPKRYRRIQTLPINNREYATFGNIPYRDLVQSAGDNYSIKVSMDKLLRVVNQPILYSAKVSKETSSVTITIKAKDREFLVRMLDLSGKQSELDNQSERIKNQNLYRRLKEQAQLSDCKLQYLIITEEQKKILHDNYIEAAYFDKDDKINIAFMPEKAEIIKKLIYPKTEQPKETEQQKNNRLYAQLKKNAALSGEKLRYRTNLTQSELELLRKEKLTFAYFINKDDKTKYNIAFEKKDEDKIKNVLSSSKRAALS